MYFFIINPKSKSGHGLKIWNSIQEELRKGGLSYKAWFTEYAGHARKLSQTLTQSSSMEIFLVVLGGDGTLNEFWTESQILVKPDCFIFPPVPVMILPEE